MAIYGCVCDDDSGVVDIEYMDGRKLAVPMNALGESLGLTPAMESKFDWLLYNEPSTSAELFLSVELEIYLAWHEKAVHEQESNIRKSLEKH